MSRSGAGKSFCLCFGLVLAACQDRGGTPVVAAQPVIDTQPPATPAAAFVQAYIKLQARLALDDAAGAKSAFSAVEQAAKAAEGALGPELEKRVQAAAGQGAAAGKLPAERAAFAALSASLLQWLGAAENPLSQSLIVAHCPMALEGKGSKWLQLGDKLQNPYFGAEMLTCGTVENKLAPGKKL
jgi:membrane fusion protein, copper/silver efflux system